MFYISHVISFLSTKDSVKAGKVGVMFRWQKLYDDKRIDNSFSKTPN